MLNPEEERQQRRSRERKLIIMIQFICVLCILLLLTENLVSLFVFGRRSLLLSLILALLIPYFGFEGARTRSIRMLTVFCGFSIGFVFLFLLTVSFEASELKNYMKDDSRPESIRKQQLHHFILSSTLRSVLAFLQIVGFILSRKLIREHLVYDAARQESLAYRASFAQNHLRQQGETTTRGLPTAFIQALPTVIIPETSLEDGAEADVCVICQDDVCAGDTLKVLPCHHRFHPKCIDPWLERSGSCPMCNQNVATLASNEASPKPPTATTAATTTTAAAAATATTTTTTTTTSSVVVVSSSSNNSNVNRTSPTEHEL